VFDGLNAIVEARNALAHRGRRDILREAQRIGRDALSTAVDVLAALSENSFMPRVVQILSRQDDVYGRHFYLGRDDRGRSERIFTPLPVKVGQLYLFYALTNPVRIHPFIFPLELKT
jgi:hypothetical protein